MWEVLDSYGVVIYRCGSLSRAGLYIDPMFGIKFNHISERWRITKNEDGSYTVKNYEGPHGMGGQLTVRKSG